MHFRLVHRLSALALVAFASIHLANHLAGVQSIAAHLAVMNAFRKVYRFPAAEALLLLCVTIQVISGLNLVVVGWRRRRGAVPRLQAWAGLYLSFFLLVHVSAILYGRAVLHLDTNFYYAAAGFHVPPFQVFFAPYYFLGVLGLFSHIGCAAYLRAARHPVHLRRIGFILPIGLGAAIAALIVLSLSGAFYPVNVPIEYQATYIGTQH